jgi:hypothetical protein
MADYDRRLNNFYTIVGGLTIGSLVVLFWLFKMQWDYSLWRAIFWTLISGVAVFIVGVIFSLFVVSRIVRAAREKFDRTFPMHSTQRKPAVAALKVLKSESNIEKELLEVLPDNTISYTDQTESPPDDQLKQELEKLQPESDGSSTDSQTQQPFVNPSFLQKPVVRQPINLYGRIPLQPKKKRIMNKQDQPEKEKFIMLDPVKDKE